MRPGFTFIEQILYTGIAAVVLVALLKVSLTVSGTREKIETVSAVQQELRFVANRITYSTRNAQGVNIGSSSFGTASGWLSLQMSGAAINPTVFFLSGKTLYISERGSGTGALTSTGILVDRFLLTNLTPSDTPETIHMEFHGTDPFSAVGEEYVDEMTITTSVTLRQ